MSSSLSSLPPGISMYSGKKSSFFERRTRRILLFSIATAPTRIRSIFSASACRFRAVVSCNNEFFFGTILYSKIFVSKPSLQQDKQNRKIFFYLLQNQKLIFSRKWTVQDSNLCPLQCECNALPLS